MAEVTEREIRAALDMEDARDRREEDDGFLGWNLHNRRKCRCWERRPGQQMCMGCERVMANAEIISKAVAEERELRKRAEDHAEKLERERDSLEMLRQEWAPKVEQLAAERAARQRAEQERDQAVARSVELPLRVFRLQASLRDAEARLRDLVKERDQLGGGLTSYCERRDAVPSNQPIKPEDIKPGDWIKFRWKGSDQERTAIVREINVVFTDGGLVRLEEVLEVRRG